EAAPRQLPFAQQPSFFCQPGGNCAQCGGASSLLPLQSPFTFLHWPGGCAAAGDAVARNPTGNAAESATAMAQSFFFMGASLPFTNAPVPPVPDRKPLGNRALRRSVPRTMLLATGGRCFVQTPVPIEARRTRT